MPREIRRSVALWGGSMEEMEEESQGDREIIYTASAFIIYIINFTSRSCACVCVCRDNGV